MNFDGVIGRSEWDADALMSDLTDWVKRTRLGHSRPPPASDHDDGDCGEPFADFYEGGENRQSFKHRQQTCPEAWWDADKDLEADEAGFLLPTVNANAPRHPRVLTVGWVPCHGLEAGPVSSSRPDCCFEPSPAFFTALSPLFSFSQAKDVVERSADELQHTREALSKAGELFHVPPGASMRPMTILSL